MNTKYSGRTTLPIHKFDDWDKNPVPINKHGSSITDVVIFEAQWTDCPVEVEAEVRSLWRNNQFGNDHYYFNWNTEGEWDEADFPNEQFDPEDEDRLSKQYPLIDEYLLARGITKCLIHWWW